ncbi:conserved hypothetical protein [Ricinus communis]|uniref:Uncharacterized protein n=1 Tax=Ricinus communis TaxID=3988 RepID=B9SDY0_RICCO|nr:conserved hypothetical protein [Ricinus communis]
MGVMLRMALEWMEMVNGGALEDRAVDMGGAKDVGGGIDVDMDGAVELVGAPDELPVDGGLSSEP